MSDNRREALEALEAALSDRSVILWPVQRFIMQCSAMQERALISETPKGETP